MGWNIGMAIILAPEPEALDLTSIVSSDWGNDPISLSEATRRDRPNKWAVGRWQDDLVIAINEFAYEQAWGTLEGAHLVFAFFLSENWGGTNTFRIHEHGAEVRRYEEDSPDLDNAHRLELGLVYEGTHPADYIDAICTRLLGCSLFSPQLEDDLELVNCGD